MKRQLAVLAILGLMLGGCGGQPKPIPLEITEPIPLEITEPEPTGEASAEASYAQVPQARYTALWFEEEHREMFDAETNTVKVLDFACAWPHALLSGSPEASKKITLRLFEETSAFVKGSSQEGSVFNTPGLEQSAARARENYTMLGEIFAPSAVERTYEITGGNSRLLSVCARDYLYMGGAHGSSVEKYLVFDTETGELLTFGDMTDGPNGLWAIVVEKMQQIAKTDPDISARMDFVEEDQIYSAVAALVREGSWYIQDDCLCFASAEYEMGSYAAGIIRFRIPMEELREHIKPRYLPEHRTPGQVSLAEKTDLLSVDLLQVGDGRDSFYLEARDSVAKLRLFTLEPYADGQTVHEGTSLWSGMDLENCALSVTAELSETVPGLGLEYDTGDGILHRCIISRSREDGSLTLSELPEF